MGIDAVFTNFDWVLGNNFETLLLLGSNPTNGTGNELNNLIDGNVGNNILMGGAGNDTINGGRGDDLLDGGLDSDRLNGGSGNDTYIVDDAGDRPSHNAIAHPAYAIARPAMPLSRPAMPL